MFLVRDKARRTLHALKVLKKDYIVQKNQVEHTKTERSVLGYVQHPFIVGLTMAFQVRFIHKHYTTRPFNFNCIALNCIVTLLVCLYSFV